jgi:hypothetical protein
MRAAYAVLLALLLAGGSAVAVGSARAASPTPAGSASAWSSYDTGRVNVVFPSPVPGIELHQDANSSVVATLSVDHIYEMPQLNGDHPWVVAAAFPTDLRVYNETPAPPTQGHLPQSMQADVTVHRVSQPLWSSPAGTVQNLTGLLTSTATLRLAYSIASSGTIAQGVQVNWSIVNWPWLSPTDTLAIEFKIAVSASAGFEGCTSSSVLVTVLNRCSGSSVPAGGVLWTPALSGVEVEGTAGPLATFNWGSVAALSGGGSARVTAGIYAVSPQVGRLVLAVPAQGADLVSGASGFVLAAPTVPVFSPVLHGDGPLYGAALAAFTASAAAGIWMYRRADRRARDEL